MFIKYISQDQAAASERPHEADLFIKLKALRFDLARTEGVPAYVIFHDATLAEMARRQPRSLAELGQITGVGSKKLDAYGPVLLGVLAQGA